MTDTFTSKDRDIFDVLDFQVERYDPVLDGSLPSPTESELSCREVLIEAMKEQSLPLTSNGLKVRDDLIKLKDRLPEKMDMESLLEWEEDILEEGIFNPNSLKKTILILDPKSIARQVGLEALVWANLIDETFYGNRNTWHRDFLARYDHCTNSMRVAAIAQKDVIGTRGSTRAALKMYELSQLLNKQDELQNSLTRIEKFIRNGRKLSPDEITRFALEGVRIDDGRAFGRRHQYGAISNDVEVGDVFYSFYLDAPLSIVLMYDGHPVGLVAAIADRPESLLINEIQAVIPRRLLAEEPVIKVEDLDSDRWELEPLHWKEFLIDSLARLAAPLGFTEIAIQSAENNKWIKADEKGKIHLPRERADRIYDSMAKKLQMTLRDDNNYSLPIDTLLRQE